jgi:hypothetical protein
VSLGRLGCYLVVSAGPICAPRWTSCFLPRPGRSPTRSCVRLDGSCISSISMLVTRGHEAISRCVARHTGGQEHKVRRESPRLASLSVSSMGSSLVLQLPGSPVGDCNNCMRVVGKTFMAPRPCIT